MAIPSVGRVVRYKVHSGDEEKLKQNAPSTLPAIIVKVYNDKCVNLQIFPDGPGHSAFKSSVLLGDDEGNWNWPQMI